MQRHSLGKAIVGILFAFVQGGQALAQPLPVGTTLEEFFTAALENSPVLDISRERWNISDARKDAATGQLLPQLNATANMSDNTRREKLVTRTYEGERYGLSMQQVLFNWQAFEERRRMALLEDQSEAEYYAQLSLLLTDVADKYLAVLQAEDELRSINSEYEAVSSQVNQLQSLFDRQLVQVTDLYESQARQAGIASQRVDIESSLSLARSALRALANLETGDLQRLPDTITVEPLAGDLSEWVERARGQNLIIQARTHAYKAAQRQVSAQRGTYMPRVSLVVQQQISNLGFDNIPIEEAESTYVGIDLQMPLFAGGSRRAGVREAESMRSIAQSELRQTQLDILEDTRTAFLQVKAAEARIDAARVLVQSTRTSEEAMRRGFELGSVTSVDLLNALRNRFQAERDMQRARYDHLRANLALQREAGDLDSGDLLTISNMLVSP